MENVSAFHEHGKHLNNEKKKIYKYQGHDEHTFIFFSCFYRLIFVVNADF